MKLIIDIPENTRTRISDIANLGIDVPLGIIACIVKAIINGTPIPDNATVCDIEQIRKEIGSIEDFEVVNGALYVREYDVIQIIDKYTKGEDK